MVELANHRGGLKASKMCPVKVKEFTIRVMTTLHFWSTVITSFDNQGRQLFDKRIGNHGSVEFGTSLSLYLSVYLVL